MDGFQKRDFLFVLFLIKKNVYVLYLSYTIFGSNVVCFRTELITFPGRVICGRFFVEDGQKQKCVAARP